MRRKAKGILDQINKSSWCNEAFDFYESRNISKNRILDQGSANFDEKIGAIGEKDWYRAAYYAGSNGYMDMHISQNRTAFREHKLVKLLQKKRVLFVDFGCGPMTSGVMLADTLSESIPNYQNQILYFGIDESKNMCEIARCVNQIDSNCHLFDRFHIQNNDSFAPNQLNSIVRQHFLPDISILCLSYVLAPKTYSGEYAAAIELARNWKNFNRKLDSCRESYIIYMNPKFMNANSNWNYFVQEYEKNSTGDWKYDKSQLKSIPVDGLPKPVVTQMITGKRRSLNVAYA